MIKGGGDKVKRERDIMEREGVCVCVCVREREREKKKKKEGGKE